MGDAAISIPQKNDRTLTVVVKDSSGTVVDITGWTLLFTVKNDSRDKDVDAIISKTITVHTNPTQGESEIPLTNSDTDIDIRTYSYDLKTVDAVGSIRTCKPGPDDFIITDIITRRNS